jgi:putative cell wall-binding protein
MTTTIRRPSAAARLLLKVAFAAAIVPLTVIPAAAAAPSVTVERLAGTNRYATAVAVSQRLFGAGPAPVVYLASGENYPDALAAGPAAAKQGGVVLLTAGASLTTETRTELIRLAPPRVVVVGGSSVVAPAVLTEVSAALAPGTVVQRVSGVGRYATAVAVSSRVFAPGTATVFVASGANFPDALAAGAAAAANGGPVLLTQPTTLTAVTAAEIRRLGPTNVVLVGGTSAVNASVATAIAALGPTVERISGADRFATGAAVDTRFFPGATTVVAVTGLNFPDALAAVPLAASLGAPILLVRPDYMPVPPRDWLIATGPTAIIIVGGPSAVSEIVRGELIGWSDGRLTVPAPGPTHPAYDSGYHDYGEMVTMIKAAEIAFPDLVQVFSIGQSYQGRDIWAAKISDNVAVDEDEPEVLFDALHHADERLGLEQALYLLRILVTEYDSDSTIHRLVNERETYIIFALNPDGWVYDLTGSPYRGWRKNRQPNEGSSYVGTDLNRNYEYMWGCCGGSLGNPAAWNFRGAARFSAPETQALRDFVDSRVVGGVQQIRTHATLHVNGEQILYPYGYNLTSIPADMTADDHSTFFAMATVMASFNGYAVMQSSHLYITDGDEIDWLYARQHIFSFTFELYPKEQYSLAKNVYPPDEVIAPQTARNRGALLYLIDMAECPYAAIGQQAAYCS